MTQELETIISQAFESKTLDDTVRAAVTRTLQGLDDGVLRVASPQKDGGWVTHQWIKKAILLSFALNDNRMMSYGRDERGAPLGSWFDKVPLKTQGWDVGDWQRHGFRAVPGAIVRHSAYIAPQCVLMPCFVNLGAYVDEGTMVDTWATIGSCAQVGKNCHISGGAGIGGVLEPLQANPVIIEDNCFIGARCEVAEGVRVGTGSVLAMGVFLSASTKIIHRDSGAVSYGSIPPYAVVVPGTVPPKKAGEPALAAAIIVKQVDQKTREKTSINALLRD
ncbi:MAG: 2,3,4,5-tetrahydropyridine-2,6-dicarboxylate N-succinyltransferase [Alphaproteobacteria bacterium GM202ARS2]|nr:2,3,4,5-tetrahydropyridine-2,6-dicarboxylate N-succinyltransferase [Alphaproteobacteria bacterium GM202ARS2]